MKDRFLKTIFEKVKQNKRITFEEGVTLYKTDDLIGLGQIADYINKQKNGLKVFFNINRHINPTNLCINKCQFCAYYRNSIEEKGAYELSIENILNQLEQDVKNGCKEVHIVGGLHPTWQFENYLDIIKSIKNKFPKIHIKAFTAVEYHHFAKISKKSVKEVIRLMKEAGVNSVPGGGAEIFSKRIRKKLCVSKISGEKWLEIMELIHKHNLKSNATMLYGHIETAFERIDHLYKLRELQDKTKGFQAFIPLSYHSENTELEQKLNIKGADGIDDLKTIAISRIFLDNFQHIKAYWVMLGKKLAQTALSFGANDLDGTVVNETITYMAGNKTDRFATTKEIVNLIKTAGKQPVERDSLYNEIKMY
jgi:aminodeoxyfutalosine synthase